VAKPDAQTDTRYSAEELRQVAEWPAVTTGLPKVVAMLRQAARDAETLAGIRAWLEKQQHGGVSGEYSEGLVFSAKEGLRELNRLSRGDA
jgi:hypothetical protein